MSHKVTIEELGGRGDGIAHVDGKTLYVPYTVTDDVVDVEISNNKAKMRHIHVESKHRTAPICDHFTKCGGCMLQHVKMDHYMTWKRGLVITALKNHGIDEIEVLPIETSPPQSRRRTNLHAIGRGKGKIVLGYAEKSSHNIIDVTMCPIVTEKISKFIDPLREFLSKLLEKKQKMTIQITEADNGLDVVFKAKGDVSLDMRMDLAGFAQTNDLARISWLDTALKKPYYEMLAERRKPFVKFSGQKVFFPEGSFLQATKAGQEALTAIMLRGIAGADHVVDLFSGCGTFSIAAAAHCNIHGVENDAGMLAALKNSSNLMDNIHKITTELRDLFLRPLLPHELNQFDVAIIDPPRAGAGQQIAEIINSDLKKLVMISCNPLTFSRDARALADAGFNIGAVTPVDQFLYSPHLEIISIFQR